MASRLAHRRRAHLLQLRAELAFLGIARHGDHDQSDHGAWASGGGSSKDDDDDGGGEYGYGVDANGESYTEYDVDANGDPKFSQSYHDKYGHVVSETGGIEYKTVITDKGNLHIADDRAGTHDRDVVQEFSNPREAEAFGNGVYAVYSGERSSYVSKSGIRVDPASASPSQDGVDVTWTSGQTSHFDGESGEDEAFMLQEGLQGIADVYDREVNG